ncbi:polysaccharide deacetylase family sporulation protein PdaB [Tepidibacillus sp. LV47]|uniref:polysaccharide deacetylase family sporulation protein PdaB n=1 Tax=Tepidibacillus sp. LV47 TaxID=3398228 RepID=UPI003AACF71C
MRFILALSGKKIKQWIVILTALFFTVGIVYTEQENISVFTNGGKKAIYSVKTDKKQIALTFDISWGEKRPGPILDILEQKGLKGKVTFFLSSPWSKDHPEIVKRIVDGGYEIGSHGHKHVNYSELSDQEIENQILKAESILKDLTNQKPTLIRTPNGDFDSRVLNIAERLGYTVIQWDTDSRDWMNPGVDEIINRVLKRVHPGDIILMHASDSCKQTHEALPVIIDKLRQQGYEFVTVSQLIANANVKSIEIE